MKKKKIITMDNEPDDDGSNGDPEDQRLWVQLDRERAARHNGDMALLIARVFLQFLEQREEFEELANAIEWHSHAEEYATRLTRVREAMTRQHATLQDLTPHLERITRPTVPTHRTITVGQRILLCGECPRPAMRMRSQGIWNEAMERRAVVTEVYTNGVEYTTDSGRQGFAAFKDVRPLYDGVP